LIQEAGNSKLHKAGFLYIRFGRITQFSLLSKTGF